MKGVPKSAEHRLNIGLASRGRQARLGHTNSTEHRARISAAKKGIATTSPEQCRINRLGKKMTEEQKARISAGLKSSEKRKQFNLARRGQKLSVARKEQIGQSARAHCEQILPECRCYGHKRVEYKGSFTYIEDILVNKVLAEFPIVRRQEKFGRKSVDAYLPPPYHLAFEADGEYWHDEKRDAKRDRELLERFGLPVIRFTGKELWRIQNVD